MNSPSVSRAGSGQERLNDAVSGLAARIVADPRWPAFATELGASILGMLIFSDSRRRPRTARSIIPAITR